MKYLLFKILFVIIYLTLLFADISSKSNNEFCFDLYKKLSADYENIIFSPYSITSALFIGRLTNPDKL